MVNKTEFVDSVNNMSADIEIAQLMDRLMRRIQAQLNSRAEDFDHHNLGPGGGILLLTLAEIEPARMHDIARAMARDKSQMTRAVQSLERKGLVDRAACPDDARGSVLSLTDEGRATVTTLQSAVAGVLGDLLAPLDPDQTEALRQALRAL
ncbi:MAG: MarR family transcriptional regulator [Pseudomonadota bacterium]